MFEEGGGLRSQVRPSAMPGKEFIRFSFASSIATLRDAV
jgi:hypothetical protein